MPQSPPYETDSYAWAREQAALLRAGGALQAADIENPAGRRCDGSASLAMTAGLGYLSRRRSRITSRRQR